MESLLSWLNSSLKEIDSDAFKDVVSVDDAESEATGDGQVVVISDIKRVSLTLATSSGVKKKLKTIAKLEALSNAGREIAACCGAFKTEIKMYNEILKSMEKQMAEVGDKEYLWAECYCTGENKLLFQDLCEEGYKIVPTHRFLDLDHSLLVMKGLGKFHGLSLVLKECSGTDMSSFKQPYYSKKLPFMEQMYLKMIESLAESIKSNWGEDWSSVPERLVKYLEKPGEILFNAWEASKDKWAVLNHGDFSMRNMLFHYEPNSTKPDRVKFVDFQMCHYSSLAHDLATLLYSSLRPKIRDENMEQLLKVYVESLTSTSRASGYKGPLPTVQDVESSIRLLDPLVVVTFTLNIPVFVASGKVNLQENADEYLNKCESMEEALKKQDQENKSYFDYNDEEIAEMLKFELTRCRNQNIF